jgi:hypothetical protein
MYDKENLAALRFDCEAPEFGHSGCQQALGAFFLLDALGCRQLERSVRKRATPAHHVNAHGGKIIAYAWKARAMNASMTMIARAFQRCCVFIARA